eukprot:3758290-Rhodomonas_salina.1
MGRSVLTWDVLRWDEYNGTARKEVSPLLSSYMPAMRRPGLISAVLCPAEKTQTSGSSSCWRRRRPSGRKRSRSHLRADHSLLSFQCSHLGMRLAGREGREGEEAQGGC